MSLINGKKVKTHTCQGIVKNKCTNVQSLSFDNNGLMREDIYKHLNPIFFFYNDLFWKKVGRFGKKWGRFGESGGILVVGAF
jgi:hypothetical protein